MATFGAEIHLIPMDSLAGVKETLSAFLCVELNVGEL